MSDLAETSYSCVSDAWAELKRREVFKNLAASVDTMPCIYTRLLKWKQRRVVGDGYMQLTKFYCTYIKHLL